MVLITGALGISGQCGHSLTGTGIAGSVAFGFDGSFSFSDSFSLSLFFSLRSAAVSF